MTGALARAAEGCTAHCHCCWNGYLFWLLEGEPSWKRADKGCASSMGGWYWDPCKLGYNLASGVCSIPNMLSHGAVAFPAPWEWQCWAERRPHLHVMQGRITRSYSQPGGQCQACQEHLHNRGMAQTPLWVSRSTSALPGGQQLFWRLDGTKLTLIQSLAGRENLSSNFQEDIGHLCWLFSVWRPFKK